MTGYSYRSIVKNIIAAILGRPDPLTAIGKQKAEELVDIRYDKYKLRGIVRIWLAILAVVFALILSACGGSTPKPEEDEQDDPPTSATRLSQAKQLLNLPATRESLDSSQIIRARVELKAIKSADSEYVEAQALLKILDQHETARHNALFWDSIKQIDDRRAEFASQLGGQIKSIDGQISSTATGFANTELLIKSPKLTPEAAAKIRSILSYADIPARNGFIRITIRNDDKVLYSEVLTK